MKERLFGMIMLLFGSQMGLQAQDFAAYQKLFWQQMSATCHAGLRWEKSVTELDVDGKATTETKIFDVDCYPGSAVAGETRIPLTKDEFGQLFECAYDNPYYAPYLDVVKDATGISANIKAGEEGRSKLRGQKFVVDPATGILRMAETHIVKSSALYDLEVDFMVHFDAAGHYTSHTVETKTDVLLGGDLHTKIEAHILQ